MRKFLQPVLAVVVGLAFGLGFTWFAGESPWHVLQILGKSAFGSNYDFGMTLFYTTPLIFTGLAVAVAFHAGLFNIGAEGQLTLGALAVGVVGALWPGLPWPVAPLLAGLAALLAGTLWGAIPGWLRAKRGSQTPRGDSPVAPKKSSWVVPRATNSVCMKLLACDRLNRWRRLVLRPISMKPLVRL